jgi:toxin-antitoxin system PIN domain toxin
MTSLSLPDINVWLALAAHEHIHSDVARHWWSTADGRIAFCRHSQLGLLRLLSTASVMNNKALSIDEAWHVYEGLFADDRVAFVAEQANADSIFRARARGTEISPKVWADSWLLSIAEAAGGTLVTLDRALAAKGAHCLLGPRV